MGYKLGVLADATRAVMVLGLVLIPWGCGGDSFGSASTGAGGSSEVAGTSGRGGKTTAVGGAGRGSGGGEVLAGSGGSGGGGAAGSGEAGGGPDAGAGPETADLVGVFVAQGQEGRITRSCDDGRTFAFNHSADDQFRCFVDDEHNCDVSDVSARGLAFGDGSFVANWGYGYPGKLQRSTNGKEWSDVMTGTPPFMGITYGRSVFVAGGSPTSVSGDGKTWSMGGKLGFDVRGIEFVPTGGGTFVAAGESGDNFAISTSHNGKVWKSASERPAQCGQDLDGIAGSDSVMVVASLEGHVCWSADGDTWNYVAVADTFTSPPIWTGSEFWIYSGAELFKSPDGQSWTDVTIEPANIVIGALARSPAGTFVAANAGWQLWYDAQQFFRSTDGVHWDVLPPPAFTGSHPISFIRFGYVPLSAGCGLP